jgi:hypothetical protein
MSPEGAPSSTTYGIIVNYAATFSRHGFTDVRQVGSVVLRIVLTLITFGGCGPATLVVRKGPKQPDGVTT